jgi:hypothetical protein
LRKALSAQTIYFAFKNLVLRARSEIIGYAVEQCIECLK